MNAPKKNNLTRHIIIGMVLGLVVGGSLNLVAPEGFIREFLVDGFFFVIGAIFIASLKLLVVPLVFVSLVCGTAALNDIRKLGRVGVKTVGLYLATTAVAITLALVAAIVIGPGIGFELRTEAVFEPKPAPPLTEVLISLFPTNPVQAMAEGNMLQIIVFAILFGLAMVLAGEPGQRLHSLFKDANDVIMKLVFILMQFAPYGVFCLIAKTFAIEGFGAILPLAKYFFLVLFVLLLHATGTYMLILKLLGRLNPIRFFKNMRTVHVFAFSTASSNATIPVTMSAVENRMGVSNSIASFTVPLGATINMDGTAIMQGVATVFIAQAYGIDMAATDYLMVVLTATLASVGTAGVPGVGLIMLAMVLNQVGLPVEGIGLIIGVDRLLDMVRTAVNVTGDATVTCVVAKSEGQIDEETFNADA
ncbi:MAG: dicarboxylate/amino acid:cation symporter [Verrucomicrobia bacterium]|nr:MAG: dicarboxylate/amino acid:cation symporter [Verrucomicrobiota bacterium]